MKQLSDYMLITDMDGTLLGPDGKIPPRNVEAIRRFTAAGGRFGIATGRSRGLMLAEVRELPINAPCVLYNGGAVYDFAADKMLYEEFLPQESTEYIRLIMEAMPHIGVLVIKEDNYFQLREELAFTEFIATRGEDHFRKSQLMELPHPWYKVLFQVLEKETEAFFALAHSIQTRGVRFVGTNATLVEMLPQHSNKGAALQKIMDMGIVRRENLVAIGDYYNDVEMIELAGLGVTLASAPESIRAKADLVVGDCSHGAVADLIEHLERACGI